MRALLPTLVPLLSLATGCLDGVELDEASAEARPAPDAAPSTCVAEIAHGGPGVTCVIRSDEAFLCEGPFNEWHDMYLPPPSTAFAAGYGHACAVTGGQLYCWGDNTYGQLGVGNRVPYASPVRVKLPAPAVDVVAGHSHTCATIETGTSLCWGRDDAGQLANGWPLQDEPSPVVTQLPPGKLRASPLETCVITAAGQAVCVGEGRSTPLPVNSPAVRDIARSIAGRERFVIIQDGRLGKTSGTAGLFVPIAALGGGFVEMALTESWQMCALRDDGQVICWDIGGSTQVLSDDAVSVSGMGYTVAFVTSTGAAYRTSGLSTIYSLKVPCP